MLRGGKKKKRKGYDYQLEIVDREVKKKKEQKKKKTELN